MGAPNTTPRPWLVAGYTVYALNESSVNRFSANVQAGFSKRGTQPDGTELAANAHQMAASGALYDALESAVAALCEHCAGLGHLIDLGLAALALARGESPTPDHRGTGEAE